jgi:hypothetical protein
VPDKLKNKLLAQFEGVYSAANLASFTCGSCAGDSREKEKKLMSFDDFDWDLLCRPDHAEVPLNKQKAVLAAMQADREHNSAELAGDHKSEPYPTAAQHDRDDVDMAGSSYDHDDTELHSQDDTMSDVSRDDDDTEPHIGDQDMADVLGDDDESDSDDDTLKFPWLHDNYPEPPIDTAQTQYDSLLIDRACIESDPETGEAVLALCKKS